jgi:hypothetical protein
MGLGDTAVLFSNLYATDLAGLGVDALPALYGYEVGPGFFGVGGDGFHDDGGVMRYSYDPVYRFPDGNHSVARKLLKKLIPEAISGEDKRRRDRPGRADLSRALLRLPPGGRRQRSVSLPDDTQSFPVQRGRSQGARGHDHAVVRRAPLDG